MARSLRNLARLAAIARTLARHDSLFWLERPEVPAWLSALARRRGRHATGRPGERLARALTELGPGFVKLGQALSTRADLVGEEIAADLSRLQDKLEPFPAAAARATIEEALGAPIASLFRSFDDAPIAAASIAQVHFAETTEGRPVAVKVLRPGVEAAFAHDLALFAWLARLAVRLVPRTRRLRPIEVVATLADTVRQEMDLRLEAAAASELAGNFRGDPEFRVPAVDWTRTGRRVLTLERIAGIPVDERERIVAAGFDPDAVLAAAARSFFRMVFRDGFFHADMHPGNVFVAPDGALAAVDFGIMGRIDVATRIFLADMLTGFLEGDYAKVADVHLRAGYVPAGQSPGAFAQAARAIAEPIMGRPLAEISLARLLAQLFEVTEQFQMETQPQLLLLQKSMLVCEGVGRSLNPGVNMWELARPLIEQWMAENRGPGARAGQLAEETLERLAGLPALLGHLERIAGDAAQGGLRLHPDSLAGIAAGRPWRWPWILLGALAGALLVALL